MTRDLQPCGTYGAWQRHKRHGEEPCEACVQANRDYVNAYRRKRYSAHATDRGVQPEVLEHGTRTSYARHYRRGEKPCAECRAASRDYMREYRARPQAA